MSVSQLQMGRGKKKEPGAMKVGPLFPPFFSPLSSFLPLLKKEDKFRGPIGDPSAAVMTSVALWSFGIRFKKL